MKDYLSIVNQNLSLDPENWNAMRKLGHEMMDDIIDFLERIGEQPVWRKMPDDAKEFLNLALPQEPESIEKVYSEFKHFIFPYTKGNIHPRYFAWVQGTGTPLGVLADMLASAMNPNVTIGEHSPMYVDKQVINWCKQMMGFPNSGSGILLSGGSMANITALCVARNYQLKRNIRKEGLKGNKENMVLYCSNETHSCIEKAVEILGLGRDSLRRISVDNHYRINLDELIETIENDIRNGFAPFCIVGNVGTLNTGAIDPIIDLKNICKKYNLWFHIDGAFGALAKLVPEFSELLQPIEEADSVAFDLHKWMYMPYEVGCALFRNADAHRNSFMNSPNYLKQEKRGLAGGPDPINNYGFELSRGFKALKVWMSIKEHGIRMYANLISQNIAQAFYTGDLIQKEKNLELVAPVTLNVVCYRYKKESLDADNENELNREILIQLQEQGIASAASTIIRNKFVIRLCIVNQRSKKSDFELLIRETIRIGNELTSTNTGAEYH